MMNRSLPFVLMLALSGPACSQDSSNDPSDDPADYSVDTSVEYAIEVSEPRWVIPSDTLPPEVDAQASNNNVDIQFFDGRLFMAWRSGPHHFANEDTQMWIISSDDGGVSWQYETMMAFGTDIREPLFLAIDGKLQLIFFELGIDPMAFEPKAMWRVWYDEPGTWSEPQLISEQEEAPWEVKVRGNKAFMTSYKYDGLHWGGDEAPIVDVYFKESQDGTTWNTVEGRDAVYVGGVSEVSFEFDEDGSLWTVGRNEDGDDTGYGSHVCWAPAHALSAWECPSVSHPERYDSPKLFRHGDEIYLVARRDPTGTFGDDDGDRIPYSSRSKTTALYQIDKENRSVVHLFDLPGAGDTAFPSIRRTGAHSFLVANYTSPLDEPDISWIRGQTSPLGTQIYLMDITFVPQAP